MAKVILLFVDGVGIGRGEAESNPCVKARTTIFRLFDTPHGIRSHAPLPYGGIPRGLDASLGVSGLPQSGTGQTTILTGYNAAQLEGRHVPAFPTRRLQALLAEHSLLKQVVRRGKRGLFLNAYRPTSSLQEERRRRRWVSASTVANRAARLPFHTLEDIRAGRALYHDFTNCALRERGFPLPCYSPVTAGGILARRVQDTDFLFFEYFQTDLAGHAQDVERGVSELEKLEAFILQILRLVDLTTTVCLLVSDHGNLEDMRVRTHTRNKALAVIWGQENGVLAGRLHSLTDVAPVVLQALEL
ncbi:MAG: peptidase [Nitrospinota bacterium]|nr:MAG: peptidase [Nitrospinota bacterium]